MKKCNYFNRIGVAQMAALAITLPFQMLPVAEGATQPENIEVSDISGLCVRFAGVGETGIGKPIGITGATRYELSGSAITVYVAPITEKGEAAILIDGKYGQVKLHAKIVLNVGAGTETITTVSPYVFSAIAAGGGGGADYKTDVYMDGVGRVIVERMEDGSTVILDEHENPIAKREANGTTKLFDAYQGERFTIDANGNIHFAELVSLALQVASNTEAIQGIAATGGASVASSVLFNDGENAEVKVAKKTEKVRVDIVPVGQSYEFHKGTDVLNFQQLNAMLQTSPDFVVFVHDNREHRCVRIELDGNPKYMEFVSPVVDSVNVKVQSFLVESVDGVQIFSIKRTDIICENKTHADELRNKVNDLSEIETEHIELHTPSGVTTRILTDDGIITKEGATSNNRILFLIEEYKKNEIVEIRFNNLHSSPVGIKFAMQSEWRQTQEGATTIPNTLKSYSIPTGVTTVQYKCPTNGFLLFAGYRVTWDGFEGRWGAFSGEYYTKQKTKDAILELIEAEKGISITSLNPRSEFLPKMMSAKKRYYTTSDATKHKPIVVAHISDIHGNWNNVERYIEFCKEYENFVDVLLNTGDTVSSYYNDETEGYNALTGVGNILNVIGNHDTRGENGWAEYAGESAYNKFFAPFISTWVENYGIVQPTSPQGKCYYYKDFAENNLRMVVVDVMSYNEEHNAWLQGVLSDALMQGYHVVIATHFTGISQDINTKPMDKVDSNYSTIYDLPSDSRQSAGYNAVSYLMSQSVDTFMQSGGNFVGYISGHFHEDIVAKVHDYPSQLIYGIGTSRGGETKDYVHTDGTRFQDDFQIISIDTYLHKVTLYKVGANVDLYGRTKNAICLDYTSGNVITDY